MKAEFVVQSFKLRKGMGGILLIANYNHEFKHFQGYLHFHFGFSLSIGIILFNCSQAFSIREIGGGEYTLMKMETCNLIFPGSEENESSSLLF